MISTKEAKAKYDGAAEERRKIVELIKREIEKHERTSTDATGAADRMTAWIFTQVLSELKTKIRFADWTEEGID